MLILGGAAPIRLHSRQAFNATWKAVFRYRAKKVAAASRRLSGGVSPSVVEKLLLLKSFFAAKHWRALPAHRAGGTPALRFISA